MLTEEIARTFVAAIRANDARAYQALWADDIVSLEPHAGEGARTEGRAALLAKHEWWEAHATMHDFTSEGPFVFGNQFALRFTMDVTMNGEQIEATEIALYTVRDGRIAEERFFSEIPG
jgi:ketosteroid isomerase-like protein